MIMLSSSLLLLSSPATRARAGPACSPRCTSRCALGRSSQMRNNPYGHDAKHMASAMGANWGSNLDRTVKAKEQAKKADTSKPDDDDGEDFDFTMS